MANYTANYHLKKPLQTEFYNIDDHNGNADIIDTQLKAVSDAAKARKYFVFVAASDSPQRFKNGADHVCDGTDDNVEIAQAMQSNTVVFLAPGTYYISGLSVLTHDVVLKGVGDVRLVLSSRIQVFDKNTEFSNIRFSHTAGYEDDVFINLNGINGHWADGVNINNCAFELQDREEYVTNALTTMGTALSGVLRITDCVFFCTGTEYDLIKREITSQVYCIVTGCAAISTENGLPRSRSINIDENDFGTESRFAVTGNINFVHTQRT